MWRKAGTIISRRLLPFSFRVASMLSRGGKSLRKDHCAPMRSHDRRIATHRHRVLCVVGVTGAVEIFIGSLLLLYYISTLHWSPRLGEGVRTPGLELTRGWACKTCNSAGWSPARQTSSRRNTLFSRVVKEHDMRSYAIVNYYVARIELSRGSSRRSYHFGEKNTRKNSRLR